MRGIKNAASERHVHLPELSQQLPVWLRHCIRLHEWFHVTYIPATLLHCQECTLVTKVPR
jgi:hypothetical protein